ncbi:hypothetical protein [Thorsellia kenyensis]|uniref:Uncharacterized protein n=1 Tax=Thorsellia kenyensis TaxID=1549888 RepID=A0ABV6CAI4_9GAMM
MSKETVNWNDFFLDHIIECALIVNMNSTVKEKILVLQEQFLEIIPSLDMQCSLEDCHQVGDINDIPLLSQAISESLKFDVIIYLDVMGNNDPFLLNEYTIVSHALFNIEADNGIKIGKIVLNDDRQLNNPQYVKSIIEKYLFNIKNQVRKLIKIRYESTQNEFLTE